MRSDNPELDGDLCDPYWGKKHPAYGRHSYGGRFRYSTHYERERGQIVSATYSWYRACERCGHEMGDSAHKVTVAVVRLCAYCNAPFASDRRSMKFCSGEHGRAFRRERGAHAQR